MIHPVLKDSLTKPYNFLILITRSNMVVNPGAKSLMYMCEYSVRYLILNTLHLTLYVPVISVPLRKTGHGETQAVCYVYLPYQCVTSSDLLFTLGDM